MTSEELHEELNEVRNEMDDRELEYQRLISCYTYASNSDKHVIWAVLNKYVPFLASEGLV